MDWRRQQKVIYCYFKSNPAQESIGNGRWRSVQNSQDLMRQIKDLPRLILKKCFSDLQILEIREPYLPTPPLGQDMTQAQFLSGV